MYFWLIAGIVLFLWVIYDLITGKVWIHRAAKRDQEPTLYWTWVGIYFLLAIYCIYPFIFY